MGNVLLPREERGARAIREEYNQARGLVKKYNKHIIEDSLITYENLNSFSEINQIFFLTDKFKCFRTNNNADSKNFHDYIEHLERLVQTETPELVAEYIEQKFPFPPAYIFEECAAYTQKQNSYMPVASFSELDTSWNESIFLLQYYFIHDQKTDKLYINPALENKDELLEWLPPEDSEDMEPRYTLKSLLTGKHVLIVCGGETNDKYHNYDQLISLTNLNNLWWEFPKQNLHNIHELYYKPANTDFNHIMILFGEAHLESDHVNSYHNLIDAFIRANSTLSVPLILFLEHGIELSMYNVPDYKKIPISANVNTVNTIHDKKYFCADQSRHELCSDVFVAAYEKHATADSKMDNQDISKIYIILYSVFYTCQRILHRMTSAEIADQDIRCKFLHFIETANVSDSDSSVLKDLHQSIEQQESLFQSHAMHAYNTLNNPPYHAQQNMEFKCSNTAAIINYYDKLNASDQISTLVDCVRIYKKMGDWKRFLEYYITYSSEYIVELNILGKIDQLTRSTVLIVAAGNDHINNLLHVLYLANSNENDIPQKNGILMEFNMSNVVSLSRSVEYIDEKYMKKVQDTSKFTDRQMKHVDFAQQMVDIIINLRDEFRIKGDDAVSGGRDLPNYYNIVMIAVCCVVILLLYVFIYSIHQAFAISRFKITNKCNMINT